MKLPKWRKTKENISSGTYAVMNRGNGDIVLVRKGWEIPIQDLIDNLPYEED